MPKAAASPFDREAETAVRATMTKLGPGLITPTVSAASTPAKADSSCIGSLRENGEGVRADVLAQADRWRWTRWKERLGGIVICLHEIAMRWQ